MNKDKTSSRNSSLSLIYHVLFPTLILLTSISFAQDSHTHWEHRVMKVANRLLESSQIDYIDMSLKFQVVDLKKPNAYAISPDLLVVTTGLLDLIENDSELGFIVAHEIGHLALGHSGKVRALTAQNQVQHELEADAFAKSLMIKSGLDYADGVNLLLRLANKKTRLGLTIGDSYPTLRLRAYALSRPSIR